VPKTILDTAVHCAHNFYDSIRSTDNPSNSISLSRNPAYMYFLAHVLKSEVVFEHFRKFRSSEQLADASVSLARYDFLLVFYSEVDRLSSSNPLKCTRSSTAHYAY